MKAKKNTGGLGQNHFDMGGKNMKALDLIIDGLVAAVLLGALLPTIADNTIGIQGKGNVTGPTSIFVGLVPLFLVIGIALVFIAGVRHRGKSGY